ncbi:hypothetical protein J7T55_009845 [Diaporthe amygdali]|uniref:uncharacterized protein n=1 Tax=Phomopsis amygdali TaxID=1214568 RepID=UPI0022FE46DB|nr:uncharacterized protein J7T55_009845 [Diaporthe amygdali]KAJ0116695.1 hypothetical protein J7T55_009845 [Diaporthe amygdali]
MPGLSERLPGSRPTSPVAPRSRPPPPARPSPALPSWVRVLLDDSNTKAKELQRFLYRGIKPRIRRNKENDLYGYLETFEIHCTFDNRTTTVHSPMVLEQSAWLRDRVAERGDPELPVCPPEHIRWWHVGWVLEYMYFGKVPGFVMLVDEQLPARYPDRLPRSITVGLVELWEAAEFFGLEGLKERAEEAFKVYMSKGIHHAILVQRGVLGARPRVDATGAAAERPAAEGLARPEIRVAHEFAQAAWKIFRGTATETHYIRYLVSDNGWLIYAPQIAEDAEALDAWESSMFDKDGFADDDELPPDRSLSPQCLNTFSVLMTNLCMWFANSGLFELEWFQAFLPEVGPRPLLYALNRIMRETVASWPRDEYPHAPFSFEREDPWRLIASNTRAVPPRPRTRNMQQDRLVIDLSFS